MDLNEDQVGELFPDAREDRTMDAVGDFHLGIDFGDDKHVVLYTDDERYALTESEMETMLDECDLDLIWGALADRLKVLRHLRTHEA